MTAGLALELQVQEGTVKNLEYLLRQQHVRKECNQNVRCIQRAMIKRRTRDLASTPALRRPRNGLASGAHNNRRFRSFSFGHSKLYGVRVDPEGKL